MRYEARELRKASERDFGGGNPSNSRGTVVDERSSQGMGVETLPLPVWEARHRVGEVFIQRGPAPHRHERVEYSSVCWEA